MRPSKDIFYKLASNPQHYKVCHELLRSVDNDGDLQFPTIMAMRDGQCIGLVSTLPSDKMVALGRIAVRRGQNGGILGMRLIEAYENVLATLKMEIYYIPVDKRFPRLISHMEEVFPGTKFGDDETHVWFKRSLTNGRIAKSA
jgi:hypothetical protein